MTSLRQLALNSIKVGDIIYGVSGAGNDKLLFVYKASNSTFFARHITSQTWAEFSRDGTTLPDGTGASCTIFSTAALPAKDYQVAVGLDQKLQRAETDADHKLTTSEIQLILNYGAFFKARPLPAE